MHTLCSATFAFLVLLCPSTTYAQWFECHPYFMGTPPYGMFPGWSMHPYSSASMLPYLLAPVSPSMWLQSPPAPFRPAWYSWQGYVIPPPQPIPHSTFHADPIVSSCRWLSLNHESCQWFRAMRPDLLATDTSILLAIANIMRWGRGYAVVAHFTEHADLTMEVLVTATPIYPGYIPQSVSGRALTSVMAMESALISASLLSP